LLLSQFRFQFGDFGAVAQTIRLSVRRVLQLPTLGLTCRVSIQAAHHTSHVARHLTLRNEAIQLINVLRQHRPRRSVSLSHRMFLPPRIIARFAQVSFNLRQLLLFGV
jgi:hypothetical protein